MESVVKKALLNSHTYSEYRKVVSDLLLEGKSTGNKQSEDLINYTNLNQTRMNRLDKTIRVPDENILELQTLKKEYIWLILAEGWCPDSAQLLPVFNKIASASDKIESKIVFRDENEDLMNLFLTNNGKAIPRLIVIEKETGKVCGNWGPRPKEANALIKNYKEKFGIVDATAKANLQLWYLRDKGLSTQEELINLMHTL
jgi:hypothetical protein